MLESFIEDIERRHKRFTVYSTDETGLPDQLATRNVTVDHRQLPPSGPDAFVAIHDDEDFAGVISMADLQELLSPPIIRPGNRDELTSGYRALFDVLEETLFVSMTRKQLLAASREIEDRALRVGRGTLRVGFQSLSIFETQQKLYRQLGNETDLNIRIYGEPDRNVPDTENISIHQDIDGSLRPYWFLAFDGGGDSAQACALLARERSDRYAGFWSYDHNLVHDILSTIEQAA